MTEKRRPTGVTVFVALEVISGITDLILGLLLALGATFSIAGMERAPLVGQLVGLLTRFVGYEIMEFLVLGILAFVLAYGSWNGRGWAWTWTLILTFVGLVIAFLPAIRNPSSGIVLLTISLLIASLVVVYYLTRPHVKAYFGK